ncbi:hypothetical protein DPMN_185865 [Dreissena polymorpha]|uniref:BTB domain-containing protein n=1 Tax=Dreissena polymorpha TaxID=45954 RepID=A0A9D4DNL5_DREPO|nr:hypothetical protein DPMN_185865 [Dreissena polymorpha]
MADFIESMEDWQADRNLLECNRFMLNNQVNCDVKFLLGLKREPISAHKYMLVCRSSVFQSIFYGAISSDSKDTIPVSDIEPEIFKNLLQYIYTDEVSVGHGNVKDLLYAAKKYAVKGLVKKCLAFLQSSINKENVCSVLEMGHTYNGKDLEASCIRFIHENAKEVSCSLVHLPKLCPCVLKPL